MTRLAILIAGLLISLPAPAAKIFTVASCEQTFSFAVTNGKIIPHAGCLFPGPFLGGPKWNDWTVIRKYFENEGYKVYGPDAK